MSTITKTGLTVYKTVPFSPIEMFNNILISNNCSKKHFLIPTSLSIVKGNLLSTFPLGENVVNVHNPLKFCLDLLRGLIELEDLGMTHGDIKLENIVLHDGNYKFIDFGIIQNLTDDCVISQTHNDCKGYAVKSGISGSGYSSLQQAMYALGITITSILSSDNYWMSKEIRGVIANVSIDDLEMRYFMSRCAYDIQVNAAQWISNNVREEFSLLVSGLVLGTFASFRNAYLMLAIDQLPLKLTLNRVLTAPASNYSFILYDSCAKKGFIPTAAATMMNLYYSFWPCVEDHGELIKNILRYYDTCEGSEVYQKMFTFSTGLEITHPMPDMIVERLLCEYLNPGTWADKDYRPLSMGNLLLKDNLPEIIIKWI